MKLFQLYPKALAHLTCKSPPGKFFRKDGLAWKPCGLHRSLWSRRPWDFHAIAYFKWKLGGLEVWTGLTLRGTHKEHEEPQRDTKKAAQGAGRACAQGARPARGPVGAWRASHATLWGNGGAGAPQRTGNRACRPEGTNLPRPRRTERPCGRQAKPLCKAATAAKAKPPSL